ncbi:hypothetical protein ACFPYI_01670 [Halomarina salina]|uniref:Uncharacterized protein n=1 Tax=Halomarina salina TaxID=1872699 RepID=A0ABD5RI55_9EURY|nr:hypothetical protein [Halomarina salina]
MTDKKHPSEMTNQELLEEIASYDEEKYPLARRARRALEAGQSSEEAGSP